MSAAPLSTSLNSTSATAAANPGARIETIYRSIHEGRMQGMPLLNPLLRVEAVGFRPWDAHWLGVLITPWFMNLMLLPRVRDRWRAAVPGDAAAYQFPAGAFEFVAGNDENLGAYRACSLFSPVLQFDGQEEARLTALAALEALFQELPEDRDTAAGMAARGKTGRGASMTKREFLRGGTVPAADESGR